MNPKIRCDTLSHGGKYLFEVFIGLQYRKEFLVVNFG